MPALASGAQPDADVARRNAEDPLDDIVNDASSLEQSAHQQESILSDPARSPGKRAAFPFDRSHS